MEHSLMWQVMVFVYLGILVLMGILLRKRTKNLTDYVISGKQVSGSLVAVVLLATMIGPAAYIGYAQFSYQIGVSAAWIPWAVKWSDILMIALFIPALARVARISPLGQTFEERFDVKTRLVVWLPYTIWMIVGIGTCFLGLGIVFEHFLGMSQTYGILLAFIVALSYTIVAGTWGVIYTDLIQAFVALIAVCIAIPVIWQAAGGISAAVNQVPSYYFNPFSIGEMKILVMSLSFAFATSVVSWRTPFMSKSPRECVKGYTIYFLLAVPITLSLIALGIFGRVAFPGIEPAQVTPTLFTTLFPPMIAGFLIVMLVGSLTASADDGMICASAVITEDIYKRFVRPTATERHYLRFARLVTILISSLSLAAALLVPVIVPLLKIGFTVAGGALFIPAAAMFLWPRMTTPAAFWSILISAVAIIIATIINAPIDPILIGLATSLILTISISLLTKPEYEKVLKFARIYGNSKLEKKAAQSLAKQGKEMEIPPLNEGLAPEYRPSKGFVISLMAYSFVCLLLFFFIWR